jgi:hypothetical protein
MDLRNLTREQRTLGAAGACVLYIISLFFPWYGVEGFTASGWDVVNSSWILLIVMAAAAGVMAADALRFELPIRVKHGAVAAFCTAFALLVTLMYLLDTNGPGRKWGLFLAFIFAIVAFVPAVMLWREDRY